MQLFARSETKEIVIIGLLYPICPMKETRGDSFHRDIVSGGPFLSETLHFSLLKSGFECSADGRKYFLQICNDKSQAFTESIK